MNTFCLLILTLLIKGHFCLKDKSSPDGDGGRCFCKLSGTIDDCCCTVETVDKINNIHIHPAISSLVRRNYFRFFTVNLQRTCPFWPDDGGCAVKDCSVDFCSKDELPQGLKQPQQTDPLVSESVFTSSNILKEKSNFEHYHGTEKCSKGELETLGDINTTLSNATRESLMEWQAYDDIGDNFCQIDDDSSDGVQHVDLLVNPEKYTGYSGFSANRIWNSIYKENCFQPEVTLGKNYAAFTNSGLEGMCFEKRVFFRLISGLHASINIHLSYHYLLSSGMYSKPIWGPNVDEFRRRFDPETTNGQGPQWLKNLYFTYLLVLRSISKAAPYWKQIKFYTGDKEEDKAVKEIIMSLLKSSESCPSTFDERLMFKGDPLKAKLLKEEFRTHFQNVSAIMNCVGCAKCRLWGKLQVQGLGTALKVLFSFPDAKQTYAAKDKRFRLTRAEIVSIFNVLGRLSSSIKILKEFREKS